MNIFLTMDYEVFFGDSSGSVEKCMIEPTNELLDLSKKNKFHYTFFWDIGHFMAIEKNMKGSDSLKNDHSLIQNQIQRMMDEGHDVQLHIHPHWEKAEWIEGKWKMNLDKHYKLSDFPVDERNKIFSKYKTRLDQVVGRESTVFRAGGWCIQPFSDFKTLFQENRMQIDSSVMPGIHWQSEQYDLDFRTVKTQEPYSFENDVCEADESGSFLEVPISSRYYSPLFFWKLYVLGRLFPGKHKMWGDGNFVSQPGGKKEMLTKGKLHHLSTDGFFASQLSNSFNKFMKDNRKHMCVIGHPKSLTRYSLKKLDDFTARNRENKRFMTLIELK